MSLNEFCDKFKSVIIKSINEETSHLKLSVRPAVKNNGCYYYPLNLKPFIPVSSAKPTSPKYWFYCKAMCMSNLECEKMKDLLPPNAKSDDEMKRYWID